MAIRIPLASLEGTVSVTVSIEGLIGWAYVYKTPELDDTDPRAQIPDAAKRTFDLGPAASLAGKTHIWSIAATGLTNDEAAGKAVFTWRQRVGGRTIDLRSYTEPLSIPEGGGSVERDGAGRFFAPRPAILTS